MNDSSLDIRLIEAIRLSKIFTVKSSLVSEWLIWSEFNEIALHSVPFFYRILL